MSDVSTRSGLEPAPVSYASGDELRIQIHRHLKLYPMLTGFEIARALGLPDPGSTGQLKVKRRLLAMERDGEAERHEGIRNNGDRRLTVRWTAT